MKNLFRGRAVSKIKRLAQIALGTAVLAFGTAVFIIPFRLVIGGVSGIAIIIGSFFPAFPLTVDAYVAILTFLLFLLGLIFLGRDFAVKTLLSSLLYPPLVSLFGTLVSPGVLGGFFNLAESSHGSLAVLVSSIFGGILIGAGCALTFRAGGSTGGVDIIAFMICKKVKKMRAPTVIFIIDAATVIVGAFAVGDIVLTLLGAVAAFVSAVTVDKIFLGDTGAYIAEIISSESERINREIIERLGRTSTLIDVRGGYSGRASKMLMVTFSMRQYSELLAVINGIDKDAFVTVHRAHEISGEGWSR